MLAERGRQIPPDDRPAAENPWDPDRLMEPRGREGAPRSEDPEVEDGATEAEDSGEGSFLDRFAPVGSKPRR